MKQKWNTWGWYSTLFTIAKDQYDNDVAKAQAAGWWDSMIRLAHKVDYSNI